MKKLKFRIWNKSFKKMEYEGFDISPKGDVWVNNFNITEQVNLMQFTGMTDKNNKEIYEGDIIKSESGYGINFAIVSLEDFFYWDGEGCVHNESMRIVGNIYEQSIGNK